MWWIKTTQEGCPPLEIATDCTTHDAAHVKLMDRALELVECGWKFPKVRYGEFEGVRESERVTLKLVWHSEGGAA